MYQLIFLCFDLIDIDNGLFGVNRHSRAFPERWNMGRLQKVEESLTKLSESEMETMTCGEVTEVQDLVSKFDLKEADDLLNDYFDGWIE